MEIKGGCLGAGVPRVGPPLNTPLAADDNEIQT